MSIPVVCPECDASYRVADTQAGRTVKCKECGAPFAVAEDAENAEDGDRAVQPRPKKGGSGKVILLVVGGLLVLLVVCGGGLGVAGWFGYKAWTDVPGKVAAKDAPVGVENMPKEMMPPFKEMPRPPMKEMPMKEMPPFMKEKMPPNMKEMPLFVKDKMKDVPPAPGSSVLDRQDTLATKNKDLAKPYQDYAVKLEVGKTYVIDMVRDQIKAGDPYLILLDAKGQKVSENDDGPMGFDSQIVFTPLVTGTYTVRATCLSGFSLPDEGMHYRLTVKLK